jgi:hypothetical protein
VEHPPPRLAQRRVVGDEQLVTPCEDMNVDGGMIIESPAEIFAHTTLHERHHHRP